MVKFQMKTFNSVWYKIYICHKILYLPKIEETQAIIDLSHQYWKWRMIHIMFTWISDGIKAALNFPASKISPKSLGDSKHHCYQEDIYVISLCTLNKGDPK